MLAIFSKNYRNKKDAEASDLWITNDYDFLGLPPWHYIITFRYVKANHHYFLFCGPDGDRTRNPRWQPEDSEPSAGPQKKKQS